MKKTTIAVSEETKNLIENSINKINNETGLNMSFNDYILKITKKYHNLFEEDEISYISKQTKYHTITDEEAQEIIDEHPELIQLAKRTQEKIKYPDHTENTSFSDEEIKKIAIKAIKDYYGRKK